VSGGPILIACECSARIRDALRSLGYDAWSCDLKECEGDARYHIQDDVRNVLGEGWAGMVAHPECTFLSNSGVKWLYIDGVKVNGRDEERWTEMREAAEFYRLLRDYEGIPVRAIENPVMHEHAFALLGSRATQFVQPWWFGEPMFKATGFQLFNLPKLVATNKLIPPKPIDLEHHRWSSIHREPPGPKRKANRSRMSLGIANAVAAQWGPYLSGVKVYG